jgi:hypothetical protein
MQAPEAPLTSARNCKCKFPLENLCAEFGAGAKEALTSTCTSTVGMESHSM